MNAEEFKALLAETLQERSGVLDFRPSGTHYYLHNPPNIIVLNKRTFRGSFRGLYVAITYDYFSNTKDAKGKFKLPNYPSDLPIFADLEIVSQQYELHKHASEFDYDLNASTREGIGQGQQVQFRNPRHSSEIMEDAKAAKEYVELIVDLLVTVGMKLSEQCTALTTFKVLTRYSKDLVLPCWTVFPDLVKYLHANNIEVPVESCGAPPKDVALNLENVAKVTRHSDPEATRLINELGAKLRTL